VEVRARAWVAELYQAVPEVDAVQISAGIRADVAALRGAFDAAVLLPNSFGSAFVPWAAGIPQRWGYATDARRPWVRAPGGRRPLDRPQPRRFLRLGQALDPGEVRRGGGPAGSPERRAHC